jgi:hypothetical protein
LILLRGNQAIKATHDRFNADIEDEGGGAALSADLRIRGGAALLDFVNFSGIGGIRVS